MKTVLLAYEREQDIAAVETLLQSRGIRVSRARSGVEALEVARRDTPHLLVTDVLLPKLDGFALCRRLHEDPLLAHVPVLLHSFRIEGPKYEAFAAEVGALRFLPRGSKLEDLAQAVEEQLLGTGTVRMPALVPELVERREQDRRRLEELDRRMHELEASNQQLAAAERVAREAAEASAHDRAEAARIHADALQALEGRLREAEAVLRETEARERRSAAAAAEAQQAASEPRPERVRIEALESRLAELQASRARAQAAALDAERAFASQPHPTWLADMETHEIHAASDTAAALFGVAREALCGRTIDELLPGGAPGDDNAEAVIATLERPGRSQVQLELRFRPVSFDGRACWITSARDVTAERAERAAQRAAFEAAELGSLALEHAPEAVCVVDSEARLQRASGAFRALLGLDAAAVAGASLEQFEVSGDSEDTFRGVALGASRVLECRWRRTDGTVFDAEVASATVTGAAGLRTIVVRDLTERRRAQRRTERELHCLESLLELTQRAPTMTEAEVLGQALAQAAHATGSQAGCVFLALPEQGHVELATVLGAEGVAADLVVLRRWRGAPPAGTALGECLAGLEPVLCDSAESLDALRQAGLPATLERQLCVPMHDKGRLLGLMLLGNKPESYDFEDRRHATRVADALSRVLLRRRADAEASGAMEHMERVMLGVIASLAALAESRDAGRTGRSRRVGELAAGIGAVLGLPAHTVRGLRATGQLIDVGMLQIPREILWRPGQLTAAEYELVKTHTERGFEILREVEFPWPVAEAVRQHHERLDGSGYPRGLKGEEILLEARIVSVADAAEAMLASRPQRAALSTTACVEELQSQAGRRYDARVVKACVKLLRERESRTEGEASVGQRIA